MGRVWLLLVAMTLGSALSGQAASPPVLPRYVGTIDAKTATRALELISNSRDKIIGLQVRVEPNSEAEFKTSGYLVSKDPSYLGVSSGKDGGYEVLVHSGYRWEHGGYVIDGFYLVKGGGMHQGTLSYGLEPVSEASVRLSRTVRDQPIK